MSVFFLGSWGMNRSVEQTNRMNRFYEPRKRHLFLNYTSHIQEVDGSETKGYGSDTLCLAVGG